MCTMKVSKEKLVLARKEAGLTQKNLAELAGSNRVHIGNIEIGKRRPSADLLANIARVLGKNMEYFFEEIPCKMDALT